MTARLTARPNGRPGSKDAIFGWTGGKMASLYTKSADRARLAREAMSALGREPNKVPLTGPVQLRATDKN